MLVFSVTVCVCEEKRQTDAFIHNKWKSLYRPGKHFPEMFSHKWLTSSHIAHICGSACVCEFFPSVNAIKDSHRAGWIWKCCSHLKQRRSTVMLSKIYLYWYSMSIWKGFTFLSLLSDNELTHEVLQWSVAHTPLTLVRSINLDAVALNTHTIQALFYMCVFTYLYISFATNLKLYAPTQCFVSFPPGV